MQAVLKTNDPVQLNFAQALLRDAGIANVIFDTEASIMDGSMGMVPRRLMVADEDALAAKALFHDGLTGYQPP